LNLLLAILGIGFLIFIHELGHFLAAKFVGVRVETFAVGFQPTIFGWKARLLAFKYGDTEYVIGLIPLGGYVQMAGEEVGQKRTDSDDEFHRKPIPGRLLILVAGATMNLIFGFLLFIFAFTAGVKQQAPIVGSATQQGPAWSAGIRSGDLIKKVNGESWSDYSNVATAIALAGSKPVTLTVDRQNQLQEFSIDPQWDPVAGRFRIGIVPAISDKIGMVQPDSLAAGVGLQVGDRLRGVRLAIPSNNWAGELQPTVAVTADGLSADRTLMALWNLRNTTAAGKLSLDILRGDESLVATIDLAPPATSKNGSETTARRGIGVVPRSRTVMAIQPGCAAEKSFRLGDELVSMRLPNDQKSQSIEILDLLTIGELVGDSDVEMILISRDGTETSVQSESMRNWIGEELIIGSGIRTVIRTSPAAQALGIDVGSEILSIGNRLVGDSDYIDDDIQSPTPIRWIDASGEARQMTHEGDPISLGLVLGTPARVGRSLFGSPAQIAGIPAGAIIDEINGVRIDRWNDLVGAIHGADEKSTDEEVQIQFTDRAGQSQQLAVTPRVLLEPLGIGMSARQFTEKHSIQDAVVQGGRQSWIWGGRIFLTLKALFAGDVHGKNLNGPVGIIDLGRKVSEVGIGNLLFLLALISINLGVFNLLPFPILDGGHIFFLLIEGIRGRPVSDRIQNSVHMVAFFLLISLALFVTYNDLLRLR
jgi:regulator of sigma E protease